MKKIISLLLISLMVLSTITVPVLGAPGDTYSNDFLTDSDLILGSSAATFVARPADGADTVTTPVPSDGVTDRALYSGLVNNGYAGVALPTPVTTDTVVEGQFRLDAKPIDSLTAGGFIQFLQIRTSSSIGTYIFSITCGDYNDTGYKIRPLYSNGTANQTSSMLVDGKYLEYKKWYTAKVYFQRDAGGKMRVSAYIGDIKIVDNQYCYGNPATVDQIGAVYAGHTNSTTTAHTGHLLVDNIRFYPIPSGVTAGISSANYEITTDEIHGIAEGTNLSEFTSKVNITNATSTVIYGNDGKTVRTGDIQTGDRLVLNPGNKVYKLYLENDIYFEDFNAAFTSGTTIGSGWKAIARPSDLQSVSYDSEPSVADDAGVDRAMLSKTLDTSKIQSAMYKAVTDNVNVEMDFRLEGLGTDVNNGNIRYLLINGTVTDTQATSYMFALSSGSAFDTNYYIRPIYTKSSGSLGNEGDLLDFKKWSKARYEINLQTDTATLYVNDKVVVENVPFFTGAFDNITNLQIFNNKNTVGESIIVDNLKVYVPEQVVVPDAYVTSDTYTVVDNTIKNIPSGTTLAGFEENIAVFNSDSNEFFDNSGLVKKTTGNVENGYKYVLSDGTTYTLYLTNHIYSEFFNGSLNAGTTKPDAWKIIEKPTDGAIVNYDTAPVATQDGAALSKTAGDMSKLKMVFDNQEGAIAIDWDFRLEGATSNTAGAIKFIDISGLKPDLTSITSFTSMTTGSMGTDNFYLRAAYQGTSLSNVFTPTVPFKTWAHAKVVLDTNTDKMTMYVNGNILQTANVKLENIGFYNGVDVGFFQYIQFYNNNNSVENNFLIDNVVVTKVEAAPPSAEPQSSVYTVDVPNLKITNIPKGTTVDQFKSNVTLTVPQETYTLVDEFGSAKTTGTISMGDQMVVGDKKYDLMIKGVITYSNFNNGIFPTGWNGTTYPDKYSIIKDDYTKLINENNYAVYGNQTSTASRLLYLSGGLTGDIEVTVQFNQPVQNTAQLKICEISNEAGKLPINISTTGSSFVVTYTNSNAYANRASVPYLVGQWNTVKIIASTETDTFSVWLNGEPVGKDLTFMGDNVAPYTSYTAEAFNDFRFYKNSGTAGEPNFYIDNFMIRTLSNNTAITSEKYVVSSDAVTGVLTNTVAAVKSGIKLADGATCEIYSTYDAATPANNVLRTGNVQTNDKLVVTAENGRTTKVYNITTVKNVEFILTDSLGREVNDLSVITDGKIGLTANIINNGFNHNSTDFVLILLAYDGNKLIASSYKTFTVGISEIPSEIKLENFTIPNVENVTIVGCVWDSFMNLRPLAAPKSVD